MPFFAACECCQCISTISLGILWCFKPSEAETIMQIQSRDLISEILPSINGHSAGWTQTGGLHTFKSSEDYKSFIQSLPV